MYWWLTEGGRFPLFSALLTRVEPKKKVFDGLCFVGVLIAPRDVVRDETTSCWATSSLVSNLNLFKERQHIFSMCWNWNNYEQKWTNVYITWNFSLIRRLFLSGHNTRPIEFLNKSGMWVLIQRSATRMCAWAKVKRSLTFCLYCFPEFSSSVIVGLNTSTAEIRSFFWSEYRFIRVYQSIEIWKRRRKSPSNVENNWQVNQ